MTDIEAILKKTLHLASKDGYQIATQLLRLTLRSLTITSSIEYRAIAEGYDRPTKDYLPIKVCV